MKKLLALALVAMMAGGAVALEFGDNGGSIGLYFSNTEFSDATTNLNPAASTPFPAYVVLIDCPVSSVGGYEVGMEKPATVLILEASGENGFNNLGAFDNHLVGYTTPLTVGGDGSVVLSTLSMMALVADVTAEILFKESTPSSFVVTPDGGGNAAGIVWHGPAIADGSNPDLLYTCFLPGGASDATAVVATLYGGGIVATEASTLTDVKALFD